VVLPTRRNQKHTTEKIKIYKSCFTLRVVAYKLVALPSAAAFLAESTNAKHSFLSVPNSKWSLRLYGMVLIEGNLSLLQK